MVRDTAAAKALRAVHAAFYLSPQTLSVGVIGAGNVGRTLLKKLAASQSRLLKQANLDAAGRFVVGRRLAEECEELGASAGDHAAAQVEVNARRFAHAALPCRYRIINPKPSQMPAKIMTNAL